MRFKYKRTPAGIEILGLERGEKIKQLEIPTDIDGIPVVTIGEEAFMGTPILSLSAPSVRRVGPCPFRDCRNLQSVDLPQATELLGFAFSGCGALDTLSIPCLSVIGPGCFEASGLREASFDTISFVGAYAFSKCRRLTKLTFGDSCSFNTIPRNFVADCNALTELRYPKDRINAIGKHAFRATKLEEIDLSSPSISRLDWCVAIDCRRLTSFRFPPHISYETEKHDFFSLQDFSQSPHVKIHLPLTAKGVYLKGVKDDQIVYYAD
ncbi:MAG: leucine-rich repeat domain-containing protein [Clostridia bacterium]|nr:leucine-rich repeat domain-containing protein [Clostridia bacterium]